MHNMLIATITAATIAFSASTIARENGYADIFVVKESSETPTAVSYTHLTLPTMQ